MTEIAVFGGTFDPPTKAHEGIIAACLEQSAIDEVWLMPSGHRPDKAGMLPDVARLAMLELVKAETFDGDERLKVIDIEQRLPQPTRTYQTVAALAERHPGHRFWYVYGADSYHQMPSWEYGAELRRAMAMLVMPRPDYELPVETEAVRHLHMPQAIDGSLSSTRLREAVAANEPLDAFTCGAVARYIARHKLYVQKQLGDTVVA